MKKRYRILSLKDLTVIAISKLCNLILDALKYPAYYAPLLKLINFYDQKGYTLAMHRHALLIQGKDDFQGSGFLIRPGTNDIDAFEQIIEQKEYLPVCGHIFNEELQDTVRLIIDAGANVGIATIFFKRQFPKARIISIEAEKLNALQLQENVRVNSLDDDVIILNRALWNSDDETLVIKNDFRGGGTWAKRVDHCLADEVQGRDGRVLSITLGRILQEQSIESIDILKIDIEGAEKELFNDPDFTQILTEKVRFIAMEIHDEFGIREHIHQTLSDNHFELFASRETSFYRNMDLTS